MYLPVEVLDTMFQTGMVVAAEGGMLEEKLFLPFSVERVTVRMGERWSARSEEMATETRVTAEREGTLELEVGLQVGKRRIVEMRGMMLAKVEEEVFASQVAEGAGARGGGARGMVYEVAWEEEEARAARSGEGETIEAAVVVVVVGLEEKTVERMARAMEKKTAVVRAAAGSKEWEEAAAATATAGVVVVVNVVGAGGEAGKKELRAWMEAMKAAAAAGGKREEAERRRVYTVTRGGQAVGRGQGEVRPWARAVWSMGRTFGAESKGRVVHVLVEAGWGRKWEERVAEEVQWGLTREGGGLWRRCEGGGEERERGARRRRKRRCLEEWW